MVIKELLDALRYKSEGTDLDFKSEQYRFAGGGDHEKSEMLKDILAIANAWRDGTGYILLGFKENRPHLAEVVGITESIDDSRLQQFVNSKVKPKLTFRYEEHLYEGKTVGVIAIPKQKRPFFIGNTYGKVMRNIAYVRRGSSTEEAEPTEVAAMATADSGRGQMLLDLAVLTPDNRAFPENFVQKYLNFPEELPDYEVPAHRSGPFGVVVHDHLWLTNSDFWREYADFVRVEESLIEMKFALVNRSETSLSNAKLEVWVEPLDGQSFEMIAGADLPDEPEMRRSTIRDVRHFPEREPRLVIDEEGLHPICHIRFGSLLPGEEGRSSDTLCVLPFGPGRLRLHFRILAGELATPQESERILTASGELLSINFGDLEEMYARALIEKYEAGQQ